MIEIAAATAGNALLGFFCSVAANDVPPRIIADNVRRWCRTGKPPLNHDLERAFSQALIEAALITVKNYKKTDCTSHEQKWFVESAETALLTLQKTNKSEPLTVLADYKGSLDWGEHILSLQSPEKNEVAARIRRQLESFMLEQLELTLKDPVPFPDDFRDFFKTPDRGNWYGYLHLCFIEQIKSNHRAETAFNLEMLTKLFGNSISPEFLISEIERVASDMTGSIRNELMNIRNEMPQAVVNELKQQFPWMETYQLQKEDEFTSRSHHTPTQDRTVCFAGYRSLPGVTELFDHVLDQVSRKANRLEKDEIIIPVTWDFSRSAEQESDRGLYAKTEAWTTIDDRVIGGGLVLDEDLGMVIDPDEAFLDIIEKRGWLKPKGPVDDVLEMRAKQRRDFYAEGGIPITYETRFAFECLFRGKPLIMIAPKTNTGGSTAVRNLVSFLKAQGVTCISEDETRHGTDWVDDLLAALPGVRLRGLPNPYRGLDYYQISDAETFVGREDEATTALELLEDALRENRGLILGITGPSGCGKSSFIRACVAAKAQQKLSLTPLEMRPTDFRLPQEVNIRCLPLLCAKISVLLEIEPPQTLVGPNAPFWRLHLPNFKKWLDRTIVDECVAPMLICLDQFEEILDDLTEGVHAEEWRALTEILIHLSARHNWPIIFTLEDSRKDRFERWKETLSLSNAYMLGLADTDTAFYRRIITKPFRDAHIDLDREIVEELLAEVASLRNEAAGSSSPLPVLALRLYSLFRDLSPCVSKSRKRSVLGQDFTHLPVTRSDLAEASLALGDVMADLAETAWRDGGGKNDLNSINFFLRPFVRISLDPDHPADAKLVLQSVQNRGYRSEQALQDAFRKLRVIVPSGGGHRLVHEAVVRRWPRAQAWFERDRAELEQEAIFRSDALKWHDVGAPEIGAPTMEAVGEAASILGANMRDWFSGDLPYLDQEADALRRYALAVFKTSYTPAAPVRPEKSDSCHIHIAAAYGLNDLLRRFFEVDPKSVNLRTKKTLQTPLAKAAWNHLSTVELLIEQGADVEAVDKDGYCPLDSAVWAGRKDIVKILLDHISPETWGAGRVNPLNGAAKMGRTDIAEMLTVKGFRHDQPTHDNWTPLHCAATAKSMGNFKYFLERGNLDARAQGQWIDWTPFHAATSNGCADIVRYILTLRVGCTLLEAPGDSGVTPLMTAALFHQHEVVDILLPFMENPNSTSLRIGRQGYNALHYALADYSLNLGSASEYLKRLTRRTVEALLKSPELDVTAKTHDGRTAWEMASGLPEVQRAIADHPRFPDDLLQDLKRNDLLKLLDEENRNLFKAAKQGDKNTFMEILARLDQKEQIDRVESVDGEMTSISELMLTHGWSAELIELITHGRIDPWDKEDAQATGLYTLALENNAVDVVSVLEQMLPESIPGEIATETILAIRSHGSKIDDPRGLIRRRIYPRMAVEDLNELMFYMARLGDAEVYSELMEYGADPKHVDAWGRNVLEVSSDALRVSLGKPALGVDAGLTGCSTFYPDDAGWGPLENSAIVEAVPKPEDLAWDDRVTWSERLLSFYPDPGVRLIRAKHPDWTPASRYLYYLTSQGNVSRLNGTSPPIHAFNTANTLDLEGGRALDYFKFFCFFVRGEDRPFYVLDGPEAHFLPDRFKAERADEDMLVSAFRRVYRGPRISGPTDEGRYRISSLIYYSNEIAVADCEVLPSGMIEMTNDWPVIDDLPEKIEAPI